MLEINIFINFFYVRKNKVKLGKKFKLLVNLMDFLVLIYYVKIKCC